MAKMTVRDVDVAGKRVMVRVDFNVPLDDSQQITSDQRIQAALPTIQYLIEHNAAVILMSHLGRPKGQVVPEMSVRPAAERLGELLGQQVQLAPDCVVADRFAADAQTQVVTREQMPVGWEGLDIGPETRRLFGAKIATARTIAWNGPLGVFEMEAFAVGTHEVADAVAAATEQGAVSIIGGGDTAAAVVQMGLAERMTHISTGGGASLECMGGRILPGVAAITEKE